MEDFDILKDALSGLASRSIVRLVNQLNLQTMEKRFDAGVIVAFSLAAHAAHHVMVSQKMLVVMAGILAPPI